MCSACAHAGWDKVVKGHPLGLPITGAVLRRAGWLGRSADAINGSVWWMCTWVDARVSKFIRRCNDQPRSVEAERTDDSAKQLDVSVRQAGRTDGSLLDDLHTSPLSLSGDRVVGFALQRRRAGQIQRQIEKFSNFTQNRCPCSPVGADLYKCLLRDPRKNPTFRHPRG